MHNLHIQLFNCSLNLLEMINGLKTFSIYSLEIFRCTYIQFLPDFMNLLAKSDVPKSGHIRTYVYTYIVVRA